MHTIKIALIGIGGYARLYVNYLLDHLNRNDYEITAVADPNPSGCQRLAQLQAVCNRFYTCAEDLFQQETVDLTVISTPIQFHADNIITALQSGSHVLCEKPMCADPRDIQRILQARNATSKFVMIDYQWSCNRSNPDARTVGQMIFMLPTQHCAPVKRQIPVFLWKFLPANLD